MAMIEPTEVTLGVPPTIDGPKIQMVLRGEHDDDESITFVIKDEDHTLGNALRYMLMKNPDVEFCGYTIPHPSEFKIHLRIQTKKDVKAADALIKALDELTNLTEH
ncbi:RNA polymerase subunit AC19, partial [Blyttiomyces sp. JEL0837]